MKKQNRLAQASSPYLQQHSENPVDWYEWGDEALKRAKTENKPLLISIGYAACHWCHVMAHESFEDETVATYMNEHFVCIKVDREERPDIDQIYMDAAQIVSGRGGWPLNAVALPDGKPFYAATYFRPEEWLNILGQLIDVFQTDFARVLRAAESISNGINSTHFAEQQDISKISTELYHTSYENHIRNIDFQLGGYNKAPKFMLPVGLEFFLQYHYFTGNEKALHAVTIALDAMALGGINDQIGGGFARYSTDAHWLVPHFEKMLYDNAQLISLYAKAFQVTGNLLFKETVEKTIVFAERELRDTSGGFYSSLDADSEHEEGRFYVFSKNEIESLLEPETAQLIAAFYNINEKGNWEEGKNIFHYTENKAEFAARHNLTIEVFEEVLSESRSIIFNARAKRVRPATDDKILCSWNALMVSAYIDAFKATSNYNYRDEAVRTARFLTNNFLQNDGSLKRVYKNGKVTIHAFLDDYALLAKALTGLFQITFDVQWLTIASNLAEYILSHFSNAEGDVLYYTSIDSENLIARKTEYSDNVIPASASLAAHVFQELGILICNPKLSSMAEKMLSKVLTETSEHGAYYANWAQLLGKLVHPSAEIVIGGIDALYKAEEFFKIYMPDTLLAGGSTENIQLLRDRVVEGKTLIYYCHDKVCNLPTDNEAAVVEMLNLNKPKTNES